MLKSIMKRHFYCMETHNYKEINYNKSLSWIKILELCLFVAIKIKHTFYNHINPSLIILSCMYIMITNI